MRKAKPKAQQVVTDPPAPASKRPTARGPRPTNRAPRVTIPVERFPGMGTNPALARAIRIYFAMQAGMARDAAIEWTDAHYPAGARPGRRVPAPKSPKPKAKKRRT